MLITNISSAFEWHRSFRTPVGGAADRKVVTSARFDSVDLARLGDQCFSQLILISCNIVDCYSSEETLEILFISCDVNLTHDCASLGASAFVRCRFFVPSAATCLPQDCWYHDPVVATHLNISIAFPWLDRHLVSFGSFKDSPTQDIFHPNRYLLFDFDGSKISLWMLATFLGILFGVPCAFELDESEKFEISRLKDIFVEMGRRRQLFKLRSAVVQNGWALSTADRLAVVLEPVTKGSYSIWVGDPFLVGTPTDSVLS